MPCYSPLVGYYAREPNQSGKRSVVFSETDAYIGAPKLLIPCGLCIGCRKRAARDWAVRCCHEKLLHRESAFVTLTYGPAHLPHLGSLVMRDLQLFMKRLRLRRPNGLRFFACGEYGDVLQRPHYHIIFFNTTFYGRKIPAGTSDSGREMFRTAELDDLWPLGRATFQDVDAGGIAYVTRYTLKKVGRPKDYYAPRAPEFQVMSRRPGLGTGWFLKYGVDAYRHDNTIVDGRETPLPRFYDGKMDVVNHVFMEELKARRVSALEPAEQTRDRLAVRELLDLKLRRDRGDM